MMAIDLAGETLIERKIGCAVIITSMHSHHTTTLNRTPGYWEKDPVVKLTPQMGPGPSKPCVEDWTETVGSYVNGAGGAAGAIGFGSSCGPVSIGWRLR